MKRPRPRTRSEIPSSIHARELVWLDEILRGYSIRKSPGVRDWAVGESSTVCPEPANEETNPVYVTPVSAMICTDGMARSLQVREEWSGTIPIARRDWFRFFQSERSLPIGMPASRADPERLRLLLHGLFPVWGRRSSGPETRPAHRSSSRGKAAAQVRVAGVHCKNEITKRSAF